MDVRQPMHSEHVKMLDTAALRRHFLVERVFVRDELALTYSQIDRIIVGGAMPVARELAFGPDLAKTFAVGSFLERRELGAINIGGPGSILVDGTSHQIGTREALFIGPGRRTCASAVPTRRRRRSSTSTAPRRIAVARRER